MLNVGDELDGFRIEEKMHVGGMAVIYRVTHPDYEAPMIMKVPRLGFGEPGTTVIGYETEEMIMRALSGPHVPQLFASGDLARTPYLVMELIPGKRLLDWIGNAPVAADEVARLGAAMATAVHALHTQHVVHLDITPGNVLFRAGGEAVLVDFGLAHHGHYPDLMAEEFSRPVGTPAYISPEQVFGVRCDPRSDIFAMGVLLYELATGRLPFGAPNTRNGLRRRLYRDPVPPRALVPTLPEWLQEVILRCLEVDARARYTSAAQVAVDLTHPDQVAVGERGRRTRRDGPWKVFRRWLQAAGFEPAPCPQVAEHLSTAPIVLVAVATAHTNEQRNQCLRDAVRRAFASERDCRVVLATVIGPSSLTSEVNEQETAANRRIRSLVQLRQWAQPVQLPGDRVSFQVFESGDPAGALLDYARVNHVDQIIIGASPPGVPFSLRGSLADRVVHEAPCSVLVVRPTTRGSAAKEPSFPGVPIEHFPETRES
jgi:nucleotide-binding universal stress UspA family protein